ncbi:MFS transporter [Streptomyces avicenniae]|uniref:MFS transporter n=1 Tax=Streptomyces avicenniae TaxID=500153 RepID=UPI00069A1A2D|nr:MFS transporter [Streptomyces avicenniae]
MSSSPVQEQAPRAGARQWFGLWILLFPVALMTADLGVLWLATPSMTADLRPTSSQLLWITDIYGFMTCGFLIVMGALGDRLGRRRLLVLGSLGVIVSSLLAAYASGPGMLITARALLGVAGAAVLPSTLALIIHMFADAKQRATAIAMWVTALSAGIAIGPVIGGVLLEYFWWGSVFLVGVPVMALALPPILLLVPEYRDPEPGRFDLVSVALFLLGILPVVYAVKRVAEDGWGVAHLAVAVVGVVFTVLFVSRQRRLAAPLLDMRLFRDRVFTGALLTLLLGMMALNGVEYLIPQFLLVVGDLSPLAAGLWLLPGASGLVVGSQLTPVLARRCRPALVLAGGTVITLIGFWLTATAPADDSGVAPSAIGLTIIMFGVAPISVLGTNLAVGAAPPEKAGAAAGAGQTAYDLGLALGIALTGTVAVAVYRGEIADALPADVPAGAAEAARDTVGGASAAAQELPGETGERLLTVAQDAFTSGLHAAAWVSAGLALVTTVVVLALLRHIPAIGGEAERESADDSPGRPSADGSRAPQEQGTVT